jgi:hypothetical protein
MDADAGDSEHDGVETGIVIRIHDGLAQGAGTTVRGIDHEIGIGSRKWYDEAENSQDDSECRSHARRCGDFRRP